MRTREDNAAVAAGVFEPDGRATVSTALCDDPVLTRIEDMS